MYHCYKFMPQHWLLQTKKLTNFTRTCNRRSTHFLAKTLSLCMAGDFNAKVGEDTRNAGVGGQCGLGETNGNGEKLINFCQENNLVITNTLFQHHKRRQYTWCSPDGKTGNQIDYILVNVGF